MRKVKIKLPIAVMSEELGLEPYGYLREGSKLVEKLKEIAPGVDVPTLDRHEYAIHFYRKLDVTVEVEVVPAVDFAALLLAHAEYLFLTLGIQAERRIDTRRVEDMLGSIKRMLKTIGAHTNGFVYKGKLKFQDVDERTPLGVLVRIPPEAKLWCPEWWALEIGTYGIYRDVFLIVPMSAKPPIPRLELKWTGNEIVAVHVNNLPPALRGALEAKNLLEQKGGER